MSGERVATNQGDTGTYAAGASYLVGGGTRSIKYVSKTS